MNRSTHSTSEDKKLALFIDFENIALGVREAKYDKFHINLILERLLEKGKIVVKKAYADWERYSEYKRPFHEAAIELIDIPQKYYSGKNSADIRMVVDAMDLSHAKDHIDIFVVASGDSDFSPLVSKLKENDKYVIGVGVKNSSSELLVDNCDEFIYYEDLVRSIQKRPRVHNVPPKKEECFTLLVAAVQALLRENKEILWGSMVKQAMQRKLPSFNEGYYGYTAFSDLLEDAQRHKIVSLRKDLKSGTYVVSGVAQAPAKPNGASVPALPSSPPAASAEKEVEPVKVPKAAATSEPQPKREGGRSRRGGRGRRGGRSRPAERSAADTVAKAGPEAVPGEA